MTVRAGKRWPLKCRCPPTALWLRLKTGPRHVPAGSSRLTLPSSRRARKQAPSRGSRIGEGSRSILLRCEKSLHAADSRPIRALGATANTMPGCSTARRARTAADEVPVALCRLIRYSDRCNKGRLQCDATPPSLPDQETFATLAAGVFFCRRPKGMSQFEFWTVSNFDQTPAANRRTLHSASVGVGHKVHRRKLRPIASTLRSPRL